MKVIFLDIDGVLNKLATTATISRTAEPLILRECVLEFNRIVFATEAKIVLSSNWRYHVIEGYMTLTGFSILLKSHSVAGELIGHTRGRKKLGEQRLWQIADWLRENANQHNVTKYCILDDDYWAFGGRPGVMTDGYVGLTPDQADEAIKILNS